MKNQLDFEKPIIELQNKLEELKRHPEKHSLDVSFEEEIKLIEKNFRNFDDGLSRAIVAPSTTQQRQGACATGPGR